MWKKIVLLGFFGLSFLPVCVRAVTTHTVRVDGLVYNPKGAIAHVSTVPVSSGNFYAGEIYGVLDGNSFLTYCVELFQGVSIGVTYTDYTVVSGVTAWGATKSVALDHLASYIALTGYGGNTAQSATVQAAVWEIIQETAVAPYSFTTGTFKEFSYTPSTQVALTAFNSNWSTVFATPITRHVDQLHSPTAQDFAVVSQVPEPRTWALFLSGMLGLPWLISRRKGKPISSRILHEGEGGVRVNRWGEKLF